MFDAEAFGTPWTSHDRPEIWWTTPAIPSQDRRKFAQFPPAGFGYANLGALLCRWRCLRLPAGGTWPPPSRLMCGEAYAQSARIASGGPLPRFAANREPMLDVIRMHRDSLRPITPKLNGAAGCGSQVWDDALELGEKHGYKTRRPPCWRHRHHRLHDGLRTTG